MGLSQGSEFEGLGFNGFGGLGFRVAQTGDSMSASDSLDRVHQTEKPYWNHVSKVARKDYNGYKRPSNFVTLS